MFPSLRNFSNASPFIFLQPYTENNSNPKTQGRRRRRRRNRRRRDVKRYYNTAITEEFRKGVTYILVSGYHTDYQVVARLTIQFRGVGYYQPPN